MQRGQISFGFLILGACLALFAQAFLAYSHKELQAETEDFRLYQLNTLCDSAAIALQDAEWKSGKAVLYQGKLQPGNIAVKLEQETCMSAEGQFGIRFFKASAEDLGLSQSRIQQLWQPGVDLEQLSASGKMLFGAQILGKEYLGNDNLYTSEGKFSLPDISFAAKYGTAAPAREEIEHYGLQPRLYYVSAREYNLDALMKLPGAAVLAGTGRITIGPNSSFEDRIIIINDFYLKNNTFLLNSTPAVQIKDNVNLKNVLILTNGMVEIGKNCQITGLIVTSGRIYLKGTSSFFQGKDCVARFPTPLFVN